MALEIGRVTDDIYCVQSTTNNNTTRQTTSDWASIMARPNEGASTSDVTVYGSLVQFGSFFEDKEIRFGSQTTTPTTSELLTQSVTVFTDAEVNTNAPSIGANFSAGPNNTPLITITGSGTGMTIDWNSNGANIGFYASSTRNWVRASGRSMRITVGSSVYLVTNNAQQADGTSAGVQTYNNITWDTVITKASGVDAVNSAGTPPSGPLAGTIEFVTVTRAFGTNSTTRTGDTLFDLGGMTFVFPDRCAPRLDDDFIYGDNISGAYTGDVNFFLDGMHGRGASVATADWDGSTGNNPRLVFDPDVTINGPTQPAGVNRVDGSFMNFTFTDNRVSSTARPTFMGGDNINNVNIKLISTDEGNVVPSMNFENSADVFVYTVHNSNISFQTYGDGVAGGGVTAGSYPAGEAFGLNLSAGLVFSSTGNGTLLFRAFPNNTILQPTFENLQVSVDGLFRHGFLSSTSSTSQPITNHVDSAFPNMRGIDLSSNTAIVQQTDGHSGNRMNFTIDHNFNHITPLAAAVDDTITYVETKSLSWGDENLINEQLTYNTSNSHAGAGTFRYQRNDNVNNPPTGTSTWSGIFFPEFGGSFGTLRVAYNANTDLSSLLDFGGINNNTTRIRIQHDANNWCEFTVSNDNISGGTSNTLQFSGITIATSAGRPQASNATLQVWDTQTATFGPPVASTIDDVNVEVGTNNTDAVSITRAISGARVFSATSYAGNTTYIFDTQTSFTPDDVEALSHTGTGTFSNGGTSVTGAYSAQKLSDTEYRIRYVGASVPNATNGNTTISLTYTKVVPGNRNVYTHNRRRQSKSNERWTAQATAASTAQNTVTITPSSALRFPANGAQLAVGTSSTRYNYTSRTGNILNGLTKTVANNEAITLNANLYGTNENIVHSPDLIHRHFRMDKAIATNVTNTAYETQNGAVDYNITMNDDAYIKDSHTDADRHGYLPTSITIGDWNDLYAFVKHDIGSNFDDLKSEYYATNGTTLDFSTQPSGAFTTLQFSGTGASSFTAGTPRATISSATVLVPSTGLGVYAGTDALSINTIKAKSINLGNNSTALNAGSAFTIEATGTITNWRTGSAATDRPLPSGSVIADGSIVLAAGASGNATVNYNWDGLNFGALNWTDFSRVAGQTGNVSIFGTANATLPQGTRPSWVIIPVTKTLTFPAAAGRVTILRANLPFNADTNPYIEFVTSDTARTITLQSAPGTNSGATFFGIGFEEFDVRWSGPGQTEIFAQYTFGNAASDDTAFNSSALPTFNSAITVARTSTSVSFDGVTITPVEESSAIVFNITGSQGDNPDPISGATMNALLGNLVDNQVVSRFQATNDITPLITLPSTSTVNLATANCSLGSGVESGIFQQHVANVFVAAGNSGDISHERVVGTGANAHTVDEVIVADRNNITQDDLVPLREALGYLLQDGNINDLVNAPYAKLTDYSDNLR